MQQTVPIDTVSLLPLLDKKLFELLRSLSPGDWNKPTLAKLWSVKDIVAHIYDGTLRTLSIARDGHAMIPDRPINSYGDLVGWLNDINADWVKASKRISPNMLITLLEQSSPAYNEYFTTLDPFGDAIFSVAWAGETVSKNWFHIARDYTEKFHHQQQVREAVGQADGLMTRELFHPFIDTLIRGLPHTYRDVQSPIGTTIRFTITTDVGGDWFVTRTADAWLITKQYTGEIHASISLDPHTAWKLFTKGINLETAKASALVDGNEELAIQSLRMVAVMA